MRSFLALALLICTAWAANIQWTGRGGTNLWDNPSNWDCSCLPTMNDNVFIAFSLGSVSVRIGLPAKAGSLTIGGSQTQYQQTLTVSGTLTVGSGTLNTNGVLVIETGPTAPFNVTQGTFYAYGNGLVFNSGLIGGNGTLLLPLGSTMNFTGPAAKEIAGNLKVDGTATVSSASGASSLFVREKGSVTVSGTLLSTSSLDISVDASASFTVASNGTFKFNGAKLLLQGPFSISTWIVTQGTAQVVNGLNSGVLTLGASSQLNLIGGPSEARTFTKVTGGAINQQGGTSTYNSLDISTLILTGGVAKCNGAQKIQQLTINGGTLAGGQVAAAAASIDFAILQGGAVVRATSLELKGLVTLQDQSTSLILASNGQGRVTAASQITFMAATQFVTEQGSQFQQGAALKFVRGSAQGAVPAASHMGTWSSSALLSSLGVPINGRGAIVLSGGATFDFTNADINADSVNSQGTFSMNQGTFAFNNVLGSGSFTGSPKSLTANSFAASAITLTDGLANFTKANIATAQLQNGILAFQTGTFGTLALSGGTFIGWTPKSTATVGSLSVTGVPAKTVQNAVVTVSSLSLSCGSQQCALFTNSATIGTK